MLPRLGLSQQILLKNEIVNPIYYNGQYSLS